MAEKRIRLERQAKIAVVTMDRQAKKNAFDAAMFEALAGVTEKLARDLPRVIVLTGAGDGPFCSGFDVGLENPMTNDLLTAVNSKDKTLALKVIQDFRQVVDRFSGLPVPIIAAVNGLAYGGGAELAVRCDMRVMDGSAEICFSEVRLGLMPDWGGGPCLARLVGTARAADMILTARVVGANEAERLGLVNRVSDRGCCLDDAMDLAGQISGNGPNAVRHALKVLRESRDLPLNKALENEAQAAANLIVSGECIHGITAFMENRPPEFPD